jgi:CDP-glucose 4,6-dehydratase
VEFSRLEHLQGLPGPILLTGHTGFKGTWMTYLMESLKVNVVGYSLPATAHSMFNRTGRIGLIPEAFADIRDYQALSNFIKIQKPSAIIHMAAQPLVMKSYEDPRETFEINVLGTVNLLDVAFKHDFVKAVLVVTTDKVYRNDNSARAFTESDPLEGKDPYSASKVATESVVSAWQQISKIYSGPKIASVRAGNVIGGGDYAENRIIPDLIRGVIHGKVTEIRNPRSTRPWLHVLDPLWGYLLTLSALIEGRQIKCINFSPKEVSKSVLEVTQIAERIWGEIKGQKLVNDESSEKNHELESFELRLNSKLAEDLLGWKTEFSQDEAIASTINWWKSLLTSQTPASKLIYGDINEFLQKKRNQVKNGGKRNPLEGC